MKIIVLVKQVPDSEANIRINADNNDIETAGIKFVMNPYDEYAMEEALRIKEKNPDTEITALTLGGPGAQDVLRNCLALGAAKVVHIKLNTEKPDSNAAAHILSRAIERLGAGLILAGKQAIDDGAFTTPGAISTMLNMPFVASAIKIELNPEAEKAVVYREIEGSTEVIECALPAVISAEKGLNQPRYASLMGIMQAKKKPIEELTLAELNIDFANVGTEQCSVPTNLNKTSILKLAYPPQRKQGEILEGEISEVVCKLVEKLKEAKVL